jgi:hypothetical protein
MASPTADGKDGQYTMVDLAADLSNLIAMGLLAVTGDPEDPRFLLTAEGEAGLERWKAELRAEARELAERRHTARLLGVGPDEGQADGLRSLP